MLGAFENPGGLRAPGGLVSENIMRFKATLSPSRVSVGARTVGDLTCEASEAGITRCRPSSQPSDVEGLDEGSCVSLQTGTWHAPGMALDGQPADVRHHKTDTSGQSWAYVGPNSVVVPACVGRTPNPAEAEHIRNVHVGRATPGEEAAGPTTVDCPKGWRFNTETGECEPRPRSPAIYLEDEGRVYGPRKWYSNQPGNVLERFSPESGDFAGQECARVDIRGYVLVTTVACCRDCAAGNGCECDCSCGGA